MQNSAIEAAKWLTHEQYDNFHDVLQALVDDVIAGDKVVDVNDYMMQYIKENFPIQYRNYEWSIADAKGRVKLELDELVQRIDKLNKFVESAKFKTLSELMRQKLNIQLTAMETYKQQLEARLEIWDKQ